MKTLKIVAALAAIAYFVRACFAKPAAAATEEEPPFGLNRQPITYAVPDGDDCCDGFPHCGCYRIG
jgi:hypothetical protein